MQPHNIFLYLQVIYIYMQRERERERESGEVISMPLSLQAALATALFGLLGEPVQNVLEISRECAALVWWDTGMQQKEP